VKSHERRARLLPQQTHMMEPQRSRADHADANRQITAPRSLRSKKRRNSSISGM